jgi:spermidine synthase
MNNKFLILFLAFIEGFAVMFVEVLSKNYLTPFFGSSLTVWTIVIGNTFLFLGIGYFLSTKLFQFNVRNSLSYIFISLSFFIVILPSWSLSLNESFSFESIKFAAFLAHFILFGPVFILFGLINPLLINWYSKENLEKLASNTGIIFFISTVGGILSCLIISFLYPNQIDANFITLFISLFILFISFFISNFKLIKLIPSTLIVSLFFIQINDKLVSQDINVNLLYHTNDFLGDLKVYDLYHPDVNTENRYLNVNNISQTNIFNNEKKISGWNYVHRISMISSLKANSNCLLVGMGGGTIASELQKLNMKLDVVDIDPRMYKLANEHFYFNKSKKTNLFIEDARYFLNKNKKRYDLIVFDVLNGESQPLNLFTLQGVEKMKTSLDKNGLIIVEFQEKASNELSAYGSICNTFLKKGFNVHTSNAGGDILDILIVASLNKFDFSSLNKQNFTENCKNLDWVDAFIEIPFNKLNEPYKNAVILDDKIPVLEKFLEKTKFDWRKTQSYNLKMFK